MLVSGVLAASAAGASRPNVVVVVADDMGFSDAGCFGGEVRTPNLDRLSAGGLRFSRFYTSARCWPSRAALLTGYYAQQVLRDTIPGVPQAGPSGLRPRWAPLLSERLRRLGYRAYHSGKWHLDGDPLRNGFEHSYRLEDQDRHFSPVVHDEDGRPLPPVDRGTSYYSSTAIADHAIRCLERHVAEHGTEPFFQYVAFTAPHFPLQALAEDVDRYRNAYARGWDEIRLERWQRMKAAGLVSEPLAPMEQGVGPPYDASAALALLGPGEVLLPLPWTDLTDEQRAFQAAKMAVHAAMVDGIDREVGRLVERLRQLGLLDDTLLIFLSDNGASAEVMVRGDGHSRTAAPGSAESYLCLGPGWSSAANTPLRRRKTWVHEGGISSPLIVHWPRGVAARGEVRRTPAHLVDVAPAILELAGGTWDAEWDGVPAPVPPGRSLARLFGKEDSTPREALWWYHEGNRALRSGDWKLVAAGESGPWELYDLGVDRSETRNLATERPDLVRRLAEEWSGRMKQFRLMALRHMEPIGPRLPPTP